MTKSSDTPCQADMAALRAHLTALKLPYMLASHQALAQSAADKAWSHVHYLTELVSAEVSARHDRRVARLVAQARLSRAQDNGSV